MASLLNLRPTPPVLSSNPPHKLTHSPLHTYISFPFKISNTHNQFLNLCRSSSTPPPSQQKASQRKRTRYRKQYPGENIGITGEMRFVSMRLRNASGKKLHLSGVNTENEEEHEEEDDDDDDVKGETWRPSQEGFLKYLVDSKLVFDTIERIVDESENVSCDVYGFWQILTSEQDYGFTFNRLRHDAYFRRTGLERCESLEKDLQWFRGQDLVIPEPSNTGVSYAKYLKELAGESAPLFLSHFYSIYFSHIAGGQVIVNKVSEKLLEGKKMEFNRWEGDAQDLLKGVREKLNVLGEHWTRDEKNKCLKETAKAFKYMGQIIRLMIL